MALSGKNKKTLLEYCVERRFFEKTAVKLYDDALRKCPRPLRGKFEEIRDQEKRHLDLLEYTIRNYGSDPQTMSHLARLSVAESQGIAQVVEKEDFKGAIDGLLAFELLDNARWELLIAAADKTGETQLNNDFEKALRDENEHLRFVRSQVVEYLYAEFEAVKAA